MRKEGGFSLIELAMVLAITGLVLGGVLKGQELLYAAKVRNLAVQLDSVKLAYLGFQDRFKDLPGDVPNAKAVNLLPNAPAGCTAGLACGNGQIDRDEVWLVWTHLAKAGFIMGDYSGTVADAAAHAGNNPVNPFGGYLQLIHDSVYDDAAEPVQLTRLNVKTGGMVPPWVLAELDRKIDDGAPMTGIVRSLGNAARTAAISGGVTVMSCNLAGAPVLWNGAADFSNCAGAVLQ